MQAVTPDQRKRTLMIIWFGMLCALIAYFFVMQMIDVGDDSGVEALFQTIFATLAGAMAGVAIYLRLVRIGRLLSTATPLSDRELSRLQSYYIVCFALSEAVGLYGFVLHVLGISLAAVVPYFAAAILILLICYPRLPA